MIIPCSLVGELQSYISTKRDKQPDAMDKRASSADTGTAEDGVETETENAHPVTGEHDHKVLGRVVEK